MPSVIVVGMQWGDEGKGKIIDLLTAQAKAIVRAQGGNNAGHTVVVGSDEYKLHLIPSGILHEGTECYIGAGTVIDPEVLLKEIAGLEARGIQVKGRLWISPSAHIIFPFHRQLDLLYEERKGARSIGTTGRGIGPCYADKANRIGVRMGELIREDLFPVVLESVVALKNEELQELYHATPIDYDSVLRTYTEFAKQLADYVVPTGRTLYELIKTGENVLLEGAQGTFLDITSGTYPFVTSSNTTAGGICIGAGLGPSLIDHTLGVIKAYTTRVGNGPLPSEVCGEDSFLDPNLDREVGTTTGRVRRAGWFDAVLANEAIRLNGVDSLALTKLDVLDRLKEIRICVAYELDGQRIDRLPAVSQDWAKIKPIYESHPGWESSTRDAQIYEQLPQNAQNYLKRISELCQVPISILSTGPARRHTMVLDDLFAPKESLV